MEGPRGSVPDTKLWTCQNIKNVQEWGINPHWISESCFESALRLRQLRPKSEVNSESLLRSQLDYFQHPFYCGLVTHVFESELRLATLNLKSARRLIVSHCWGQTPQNWWLIQLVFYFESISSSPIGETWSDCMYPLSELKSCFLNSPITMWCWHNWCPLPKHPQEIYDLRLWSICG